MSKKLWGGRFAKKTDPLVEKFTRSIQYDYKLAEYDILGSMIHVEVLRKAGYLKNDEASSLYKALDSIYKSVRNKAFKPDPASEDIHTDIQNKLYAKLGGLALKLHTARSRNEQVAFSTKLYCKITLSGLQSVMSDLAKSISSLASRNKHIIIAGYTHMQHAQPVYLEDYLWAYIEMLKRDNSRLEEIGNNIKLTMGAGALAGTPISAAHYSIKAPAGIGRLSKSNSFDIQVTVNSLDAVSDRDFVIEILSALSLVAMHLSRLSEDLIIWSTKEFGFVEIDDAFCTGSSLMPQKKNPDVLELIRGYAGRIYGNLVSAMVMMKGLPLSYNRDMQLDKEPLFSSLEIVSDEIGVLKGLIDTLKFNDVRIKEHLKDESLYATDLVYYLVDLGIPFKTAHTLIGELIKYSIDSSTSIKDMTEAELKKKLSGKASKAEIVKRLDPVFSVKSKRSIRRRA